MQDKALEFEKLRGAQRMSEIGASADAAWNTGAIEALRDAVRPQGEKTGVAWAESALSSSVRPVITYWTIGYGHLCDPKHPPITEADADIYLEYDLMTALKAEGDVTVLSGAGCRIRSAAGGYRGFHV